MTVTDLESIQFLGSHLINFASMGELLYRLTINLTVCAFIVKGIFLPIYRDRNYVFALGLINISTFLICLLMSGVKLKIGFAFGLFAVFSIIRYRTEQVPIKQMTYLFLVIVVAVINALANSEVSHAELIFTNAFVVGLVYYLDRIWYRQRGGVKTVRYEKIDLIRPENQAQLYADLRRRTGLNIVRVDVVEINFLNDTAEIRIHFDKPSEVDFSVAA
ncbi:MAG: DUF4956 domain-containing protein [Bdellovibrionaceae bacterium]|nr:DUF4956 domain-containing protein [Bdellovibrionales bacterium]MCB9083224.1 DUF4956 domain-containing protein [Pseudobdellovibrionaceae bacterium]